MEKTMEALRNEIKNYAYANGYKEDEVVESDLALINDTSVPRITFMQKDSIIHPSIRLTDEILCLYKKKGFKQIEEVLQSIFMDKNNYSKFSNISNQIFEYEKCKHNIIAFFINTERNNKMLEKLVHRQVLDLSVVYAFVSNDQKYTTRITTELLQKWGITEEQLYQTAVRNMNERDYYVMKLTDPDDVASCLESCSKNIIAPELPLSVGTNAVANHGSGIILRDDVLKKVYEAYNGEFYLIPSSIHEWLFVKVPCLSIEDYKEMVKDVNENHIKNDEFLSDNVYLFDGVSLSIA